MWLDAEEDTKTLAAGEKDEEQFLLFDWGWDGLEL